MKPAIIALTVGFFSCPPLWGEFLPPAHQVFQSLRADPRELQYTLRLVEPVSRKLLGEAAIGDYLGLYRWTLGSDAALQISAGGGAFGLFDLSGTTNDMQVVDFYGNLPLDFRQGPWSMRLMIYHTSSHLGDDFLKVRGGVTEKHSWDNVKWLGSYEPTRHVRLYGGYNYILRTLPGGIGRHAVQGGMEWQSPWVFSGIGQFYWANDIQSWERTHWNMMFNSEAGLTLAKNQDASRAVSIFLEYSAGRQAYGQFYLQEQSRWSLGVRFSLT